MKTAKELKKYKRKMARWQTESEAKFEKALIWKKLDYKKQLILGFYILDFVIPSKLVAIEIDGLYHDNKEMIRKDVLRSVFIEKCGFKIIRIKNNNVELFNIDCLKSLPNHTEKEFRHVLAMGNAYKSKYIRK